MSEKPASHQSVFVERFNFLPCCVFVCVCVFSFPQRREGNKEKSNERKNKENQELDSQ